MLSDLITFVTWGAMPKKIRQLIAELEAHGFILKTTRGDHRKYEKGGRVVMISGGKGDDALKYQEKAVRQAIQETE